MFDSVRSKRKNLSFFTRMLLKIINGVAFTKKNGQKIY